MNPPFGCSTKAAIEALAIELNLPYDSTNQDWSYTVGNPSDFEKYMAHYKQTNDEDKRFVLMEIMIQAVEDQNSKELFSKYWRKLKPILVKDFDIHAYTINYWACLDNLNINDCWKLSRVMRNVLKKIPTETSPQ